MRKLIKHPWRWYCNDGCKILIIGTFPTKKKNWSFNFFYPNSKNLFWSVMAHLANSRILNFDDNKEQAINERKGILDQLKLGITDMGLHIKRVANSSSDKDLKLIRYMPIHKILDEFPSIETLFLTSSSGKNSAFKWFADYCKKEGHIFEYKKQKLPFYGTANINSKEYRIVVIRSTSPQGFGGMNQVVPIYVSELNRLGIKF